LNLKGIRNGIMYTSGTYYIGASPANEAIIFIRRFHGIHGMMVKEEKAETILLSYNIYYDSDDSTTLYIVASQILAEKEEIRICY
jgi:hypothetical protein